MNKKLFVGVSIILSVLFLTQAAIVYAGKPETIYFYSDFGQFQVDDSQTILNDDGLPYIRQYWFSGTMYNPGFPAPVMGTFNSVDTFVYYYDRDGNLKYYKLTQKLTITTTAGDTLSIESKFKFIYGVPLDFQRPGSWTIVDGTGLLAGVSGRGEYLPPFRYWGKIS